MLQCGGRVIEKAQRDPARHEVVFGTVIRIGRRRSFAHDPIGGCCVAEIDRVVGGATSSRRDHGPGSAGASGRRVCDGVTLRSGNSQKWRRRGQYDGLSDADVLRRHADLEFETPIMKAALVTGDISRVKETLDYLLALFGINLERRSEAYRRLGMAVLRKRVAALEVIKRRVEGEPIETPPLPAIGANPLPGGETLTAAFEGWKRQRERAPGTVTEYERASQYFEDRLAVASDVRMIQAWIGFSDIQEVSRPFR